MLLVVTGDSCQQLLSVCAVTLVFLALHTLRVQLRFSPLRACVKNVSFTFLTVAPYGQSETPVCLSHSDIFLLMAASGPESLSRPHCPVPQSGANS